MDSGRKIPEHLDCPLDNFILEKIVIPLNPYFRSLGATPNILTGISGIFGLLAVYFAYKSEYILTAIFYAISYIFDCFDGNFARTYDMVTEFGDWFDHVKDVTVVFLLVLVLSFKKEIKTNLKLVLFVLFIVLLILNNLYIINQEDYYHTKFPETKKSGSLGFINGLFKFLVPEQPKSFNERFKYTKYFGCGTVNLYIILVLVLFNLKKQSKNF